MNKQSQGGNLHKSAFLKSAIVKSEKPQRSTTRTSEMDELGKYIDKMDKEMTEFRQNEDLQNEYDAKTRSITVSSFSSSDRSFRVEYGTELPQKQAEKEQVL